MNIQELREWGRRTLATTSAGLDVDLLLSHASGRDRSWVVATREECDGEVELTFRSLLRRRENREPVAYLTGRREFYGREFFVQPGVLIPRPESELLVEFGIKELKQCEENTLLLDVGTGSGALLLSILSELSQELIPKGTSSHCIVAALGIDCSASAIAVAKRNAVLFGQPQSIFVQGDLLSPVLSQVLPKRLVIVANLPYIAEDEVLPSDVISYEPPIALWGGKDGLLLIRRLISQLNSLFNQRAAQPGSMLKEIVLFAEFGSQLPGQLRELGPATAIHKDLAGIYRVAEYRWGQ